MDKPRYRVQAGDMTGESARVAAMASVPGGAVSGGRSYFEAASRGRRLSAFPSVRKHINVALQQAGSTLVARARWLYENDGYAGNAVDEWVSAAVGDGIKPRPKIKDPKLKSTLVDLFWRWTEEADADGLTDYYGIQEKVAREAYMGGECFVRFRPRRRSDMWTVPFQLQVLPSEMLDISYDEELPGGNYIRCGIEFNPIGRRVAYHFWREHPDDLHKARNFRRDQRTRVPAREVVHVFDGRQGSQIRGVPRIARVLTKLFSLEMYDDAELERKKTTALFTGFLIGRGDPPVDLDGEEETEGGAAGIAGMEPGALVDLGDDRDVKFSNPAEVGNSYEPFQYRTLLKVSAGCGVPYAYVTGDTTKGNFSNVRTDIIRFRRRIGQWQNNTLIFQLCRAVWVKFVEYAVLANMVDLPGYDEDPTPYWAAEHLPPRQEWVDPSKDIKAEREAVDAGFKTRTQVIATLGYDREEIDAERAEEQEAEKALGLSSAPPPGGAGAPPPPDDVPDEDEEKEIKEPDSDAP